MLSCWAMTNQFDYLQESNWVHDSIHLNPQALLPRQFPGSDLQCCSRKFLRAKKGRIHGPSHHSRAWLLFGTNGLCHPAMCKGRVSDDPEGSCLLKTSFCSPEEVSSSSRRRKPLASRRKRCLSDWALRCSLSARCSAG